MNYNAFYHPAFASKELIIHKIDAPAQVDIA